MRIAVRELDVDDMMMMLDRPPTYAAMVPIAGRSACRGPGRRAQPEHAAARRLRPGRSSPSITSSCARSYAFLRRDQRCRDRRGDHQREQREPEYRAAVLEEIARDPPKRAARRARQGLDSRGGATASMARFLVGRASARRVGSRRTRSPIDARVAIAGIATSASDSRTRGRAPSTGRRRRG